MYREIILNSNDFTRGSINRPEFWFPENLHLKKFCVRSVEVPYFYLNHPNRETWIINAYDIDGNKIEDSSISADVPPKNFETVNDLAEQLQELAFLITGGGPTFGVNMSSPNFIQLLSPWTNADVHTFTFQFVSGSSVSKYFRKLLGYTSNTKYNSVNGTFSQLITESVHYDAKTMNTNTIGALKMTQDNYILLKSDGMSGASFTPNTTRHGSFASASILAKIPTNFSEHVYGTYNFYHVDSPNAETMFSYNSDILSKFDLYFTRPNDDDVIDFQGFNFSVTLGIITDE